MSSASFLLQPFQGDEAESNQKYRVSWRPSLLSELARHAYPVHENGLLGIALDAAEFATFNPVPFVRLAQPIAPGAAGTAGAWSNFKHVNSEFELQQQSEALAVRSILANLGETPRELLRDPVTRRYYNDLALILRTLDAHYKPVTRQELLNGIDVLSIKYNRAKDFKAFVTTHRQMHNTFAAAGQPLSELDKIKYLSAAVEYDADIRACIHLYYTSVPELAGQTFDNLASRIVSIVNNKPPSSPINEFVAATVMTSSPNIASEIEALRKENSEIKKQLQNVQQRRSRSYCWTHGSVTGNHNSQTCRYPADGHIRDATFKNQLGGKAPTLPNRK